MFSLQQLFGKGDKFYDLLEASAEEAKASGDALGKILSAPAGKASLEEFVLSRRKEKRISEEIAERLVDTFVTGLEREDIEELSNALYRIPKTVEKFAERYQISTGQLEGITFHRQAVLLEKSTATLVSMVKLLRKMPPLEQVKDLNDKLQILEGEADKVMLELTAELYQGKHEALQIIIVRDLYDLLEKVIDRCRDAGNVVSHIVMKNS
ncbi:MAG: DUF47 family protein [Pedosphaera sp.]|nr:DUF47 family protein [Pedosphaera sp.]MSU42804.1 DUF47 family protein [Pedosphaera sp.]